MSGSVNKVTLLGRLGQDPEAREMQNGGKLIQLSVATSERWRDKASGEPRERTEWHRVVIFNQRLADVAETYLSKGDLVYLEGQLRTSKWIDESCHERFTTEVVLPRFGGVLTLLGRRDDDATEEAA